MLCVRAAAAAALVMIGSLAAGCAAEEASPDRSWDSEITASKGGNATCAPQTCASAGKACGTHDDGCGGQIDCGQCVDSQCVPKSCEELGKTCGKSDDGCGGIVDCGACATCTADSRAGNTSADKASDLGPMTDSPVTNKRFEALSLGEGEEDWFKFTLTDAGFGGNPLITVSASGSGLEVSAFYLCNSSSNASKCPVEGQTPDATVGKGCMGAGTATVWTECDGLNESGSGFVRVRKTSGGQQCVGYALEVKVEQKLF